MLSAREVCHQPAVTWETPSVHEVVARVLPRLGWWAAELDEPLLLRGLKVHLGAPKQFATVVTERLALHAEYIREAGGDHRRYPSQRGW